VIDDLAHTAQQATMLRFLSHNSELPYRWLQKAWAQLNDILLNIDTGTVPNHQPASNQASRPWWFGTYSDRARHNDNYQYASPDFWYIRKVVQLLALCPQDVVYDLGAGKGRFVCCAARAPVRKCVGVELVESLCEVARKNASSLRGRKAPIEIVRGDAAGADLSDGTVYFMFNPFGPETMRDTLSNIRSSLVNNPRQITIVYYNPQHESMFAMCPWLDKYHEFRTHGGLRVTFWKNPSVFTALVDRTSKSIASTCNQTQPVAAQ
jgi:cyclopropane fatty-acyl-phospholipid synthase-like methyltransferase